MQEEHCHVCVVLQLNQELKVIKGPPILEVYVLDKENSKTDF